MTALLKSLPATLILGLLLSMTISGCANENPEPTTQTTESSSQNMLRHVVFFSFTEDASDDDINDIGQTLMALEDSIEEIQSLEWGENVAEGQNYSHCLLVNFTSKEDLAVYADHPDHLKFIDDYKQYFDQVTEIDYWTGN